MNVVVIGAGMMGTAFTTPLADAGHRVSLVGTHLDTDIVEEMQETRVHPRLSQKIHDSVSLFTISGIEHALKDADLIVVGVNSEGVSWAASILARVLHQKIPIVMLTKGLYGDGENLKILPHYLSSQLPENLKDIEILAIGGPCIAGELAARNHSSVVLGGTNKVLLAKLAKAFQTPYYHIWITTDLIGLEVCVALKNLYALAAGIVMGLLEREDRQKVHNPVAAIFAQSLYEMAYIVDYLGGRLESVYTLPGAGDLYVTCQGGRNSRMGRLIGLGLKYEEAKQRYMPGESVEGALLVEAIGSTVRAMVSSGRLDRERMPLLWHLIDVICEGADVAIPWESFFQGWAVNVS